MSLASNTWLEWSLVRLFFAVVCTIASALCYNQQAPARALFFALVALVLAVWRPDHE